MPHLGHIHVVCAAVNVPGPAAAARLRDLGARVSKVEPVEGDKLAFACPEWYRALTRDMELATLDLKAAREQARFGEMLATADLLITSNRPSALARIGLDWETLHARFPRLCHVAIVGYPPPHEEHAGHDLTYLAPQGLLTPPALPHTLVADLAGAERAASAGLALLLAREQTGAAGRELVALSDAASAFAAPMRFGLTRPGGILGGGLPSYGLYETADGWIAVAALEDRFFTRLCRELKIERAESDDLQRVFLGRTAADWELWARERDLPIAAVRV